jgi:hypothetical protein
MPLVKLFCSKQHTYFLKYACNIYYEQSAKYLYGSLTLCLQLTLYTQGLDLMLHSKYTSIPSRIELAFRLLPSSRLTIGTSENNKKIDKTVIGLVLKRFKRNKLV